MKWWIKERRNPQLGTYYVAEGRMFKKDAKRQERPLYGLNVMHPFDTEEQYKRRIAELLKAGESVIGADP